MGYISGKLKRRLYQAQGQRQRTPISNLRSLVWQVKGEIGSPRSSLRMAEYHPNHAAYLVAQNMVSHLAEELSVLPEMRAYAEVVGPAEEKYIPQGPPLSPLTTSYFTTWAFFDATFGRSRETLGTCLLDIGPDLGLSPDYLDVIRLMQQSRMGVYEHHGVKGKHVHLQELITNLPYTCLVPAGYLGKAGELWYARVLPPPFTDADAAKEAIVFTTPYLLVAPGKEEWTDFLNRTMSKRRPASGPAQADLGGEYPALAALMKHGLDQNYWHEFVLLAYLNHRYDVILLTGLPDVPESLPHTSHQSWR
jgi:hypothetical protein